MCYVTLVVVRGPLDYEILLTRRVFQVILNLCEELESAWAPGGCILDLLLQKTTITPSSVARWSDVISY